MLRPVREDHPLLAPAAEDTTEVNGETYGPLKLACENIVWEIFGDRGTVLRPQIVAGPQDPSGRYSYWVNRAAQDTRLWSQGIDCPDTLSPKREAELIQLHRAAHSPVSL
jgi:2'-hydroxyisoflavone reductase